MRREDAKACLQAICLQAKCELENALLRLAPSLRGALATKQSQTAAAEGFPDCFRLRPKASADKSLR